MKKAEFKEWVILELMGRQKVVGKSSTISIGGVEFLKITIPKTTAFKKFVKYYRPDVIYSITPISKEYAKQIARNLQVLPIDEYYHNTAIDSIVEAKLKEKEAMQTIMNKIESEEKPQNTNTSEAEDDLPF